MNAAVFIAILSVVWIVEANNEFTKHHDYTAMVDVMRSVNEKCPDITRLYTLPMDDTFQVPATTWENRKLWVIEFAKAPGQHVPRKLSTLYFSIWFCYYCNNLDSWQT